MKSILRNSLFTALGLCSLLFTGCATLKRAKKLYKPPAPPQAVGTQSDHIWMTHERNAEALDFVVYQHEFESNDDRLNSAGMDHVKQIAARLRHGQQFPVVIERSSTSERPTGKGSYPIHANPALDLQRREVVVHSLVALGVPDAEQRVVVAPELRPGMKATEASRAYSMGFQSGIGGRGTFGNAGFGGF